ncbi:hypothetical protein LNI96_11635 [Tenacibaculum dicentrarchi]|nr:hypothetical protein [Tenacibaculum dicentrarchi]
MPKQKNKRAISFPTQKLRIAMSKITQIERELLIANDSIFHRLCSSYIHYKYNYPITDKGLAKGKDKPAKGTPDSYILDNGKTLFVEVSTQESGIFKKFSQDIDKCLSIVKSGVEIEKIFLCYNSRIDIADKSNLLELGIKNDTQIEIISLDELKYDLLRPYGFLANEFLGIELDTGQILEIDRFIYENDKKTTSLQNPFVSRKDELEKVIETLDQNRIVILSGHPGTGKTRLAIETAIKFKEKIPLLKTYTITNKGQSIYNDLHSYFLPNNEYLVIVDDANRVGELNRILELSLLDELSIRIMVTVRDYALSKIIKQFNEIEKLSFHPIKVEKLTSKEIEEILSSLNITNPLCVNKITYISNGNPRLAMMAAEHALETNNCHALNNVTDIYDKYFSKYINEIEELNNKDLLKTLGIIAFNRNFNKENVEFNNTTYDAFEISENDFWENVFILHDLELVDLLEKQIVKISDQIIAEYFFYYIFIKESIVGFSKILNTYLNDYSGKIRDNLYPVLNNFDQFKIMEIIKDSVDQYYESIKTNEDLVYKFFEIFWFDRKTELLIWLQDKIELIEIKPDVTFNFAEQKDIYDFNKCPYIELLKLFGHHPDENFVISLEILLSYVFKEPKILPDVVKYLKDDLAFNTQSSEQNYYIQIRLFDFLFDKIQNDPESNFYKELVLELTDKFLQIYFEDSKSGVRDRNTFVISQVYIQPTEEIKKLRSLLWEFLLDEFYNFEEKAFKTLSNYIKQSYSSLFRYEERNKKDTPAKKVAEFDKSYVVQFFDNILSNENYLHCKLFDSFMDRYEIDNEEFSHLKKKFTNRIYELSLTLKWDFLNLKRNYDVGVKDELKELKKREIQEYFRDYNYEEYIQLFEDLSYLLKVESNHSFGFQNSLEIIFLQLLELDSDLLLSILTHIISSGNLIEFNSYYVIDSLVNNSKYDTITIYKLISQDNKYKNKCIWNQNFFHCLKEEEVSEFYYSELIELYKNWESNFYVRFEFWSKFKKEEPSIFITAFKILLNKTKTTEFRFDFHYWTLFENFIVEFEADYNCLKELYLYKEQNDNHFDYDKKYLKKLVEIDNYFLFIVLGILYLNNDHKSSRHENYRFDFIWEFDNYESLIEKSIEILKSEFSIGDDVINFLFPANINENVTTFLSNYIQKNHDNAEMLGKIFNVITYSYSDNRIFFLSVLLKYLTDLEIIKSLELIQNFKSGGSLIPLYEADKRFWKDFEVLLSSNVKYLKLKLWTRQNQMSCDRTIEWHRKRDFVRDF